MHPNPRKNNYFFDMPLPSVNVSSITEQLSFLVLYKTHHCWRIYSALLTSVTDWFVAVFADRKNEMLNASINLNPSITYSDQQLISAHNITTCSNMQVRRINEMISKDKMPQSLNSLNFSVRYSLVDSTILWRSTRWLSRSNLWIHS